MVGVGQSNLGSVKIRLQGRVITSKGFAVEKTDLGREIGRVRAERKLAVPRFLVCRDFSLEGSTVSISVY